MLKRRNRICCSAAIETGKLKQSKRNYGLIQGLGAERTNHRFSVVSGMAANLLLFDDLGNIWDGGSPRLRASFSADQTHDEFSAYVVKNMGFVAVNIYGRSCEIRLRPRLVKEATYSALCDWIRERIFDRVVTAHFEDDWVYGLHANQQKAIDRLQAVLSKAQAPRPGDYLVRKLSPEELPRTTPQHRALHSLIANWPMLSQSVHRDGLSNIIQSSLQGRYHIIDANEGSRDLTFREIGHGFMSYSDDWVARAIGKSIEQQEDLAYGKWVGTAYREALQACVPMVCDVDTIMTTPKLGRARVRYKRVLLPSRSVGGGTWLLNSSIIDPTIDLRADLLEKSA